ncbi:expressed unknown protein [Seminavis robusta]|uniref:Uncharacterized protein n=1 Tax=Seminavis robusta TaxID=568900 RepID=A0A9N8HJB9_9STRA|nr:expressed unknown protein [Seminavis robusta]|eukprot:Sro683_g186640.1 n/a (405) ;mRNA; r:24388-25602
MISTMHLNTNMPPSPLKRSFGSFNSSSSSLMDLNAFGLFDLDNLSTSASVTDLQLKGLKSGLDDDQSQSQSSLMCKLENDLDLDMNMDLGLNLTDGQKPFSLLGSLIQAEQKHDQQDDQQEDDQQQDDQQQDDQQDDQQEAQEQEEPPKKKLKLQAKAEPQAKAKAEPQPAKVTTINSTVEAEQAEPEPEPEQAACPYLLHQLCQAFPTDKWIINTALMLEEKVADVPASIPVLVGSKVATGNHGKIVAMQAKSSKKDKKKPLIDFAYPVNIAINNQASSDVVKVLANAAPQVLVQPEAPSGLTTLQIALQKQPKNFKLIQALLQANPTSSQVLTNRKSTPLHMACQKGCPLPIVQAIFKANPAALHQQNLHGETPLLLAERTLICPEDVANYLQAHASRRLRK